MGICNSKRRLDSTDNARIENLHCYFYFDRLTKSLFEIKQKRVSKGTLKLSNKFSNLSALGYLAGRKLMIAGGFFENALVSKVGIIDLMEKRYFKLSSLPVPCMQGHLHELGDWVYYVGSIMQSQRSGPFLRFHLKQEIWETLPDIGENLIKLSSLLDYGSSIMGNKIIIIGGYILDGNELKPNSSIFSISITGGKLLFKLESNSGINIARPLFASGEKNGIIIGGKNLQDKYNKTCYKIAFKNKKIQVRSIGVLDYEIEENYPPMYNSEFALFVSYPLVFIRYLNKKKWAISDIKGKVKKSDSNIEDAKDTVKESFIADTDDKKSVSRMREESKKLLLLDIPRRKNSKTGSVTNSFNSNSSSAINEKKPQSASSCANLKYNINISSRDQSFEKEEYSKNHSKEIAKDFFEDFVSNSAKLERTILSPETAEPKSIKLPVPKPKIKETKPLESVIIKENNSGEDKRDMVSEISSSSSSYSSFSEYIDISISHENSSRKNSSRALSKNNSPLRSNDILESLGIDKTRSRGSSRRSSNQDSEEKKIDSSLLTSTNNDIQSKNDSGYSSIKKKFSPRSYIDNEWDSDRNKDEIKKIEEGIGAPNTGIYANDSIGSISPPVILLTNSREFEKTRYNFTKNGGFGWLSDQNALNDKSVKKNFNLKISSSSSSSSSSSKLYSTEDRSGQ